ncbi:vWA domain-containing protein [Aquihabitans sp. McL0605]|uniref:vWA domain-containing protein n=1 Tax=Aquihabitans sp. McL0605 TaxID=3415671 RepID=UPI003CEE182A
MRAAAVRLLLALVVATLALGVVATAPAGAQGTPSTTSSSATGSAPKTASGDAAIDDLVGCVQGSRRLLVLFLIDESASLHQNDPENRRVDAARGALDSLVAMAGGEGANSPEVQVALAGFSNEYRLVQDWTPAKAGTSKELNAALDEFAGFNHGIDTDFVNALSSGRSALAEQAAAITETGGEPPCRAVMLFTDGGFDIAVRTTEKDQKRLGTTKPYAPGIELTTPDNVIAAERAGRAALCEPGGLADKLRADDITLLTVALAGKVSRRAQIPLAAATVGAADGVPCGTQPAKGQTARPQGAYLPADDIGLLVTQFYGVGIRLAGGNPVEGSDQVKICGKDACDEGTRTFKLDSSLRRAQILSLAPKPGTAVKLTAPSGATATISDVGTSQVGGVTAVARQVAGRGLTIDLDRPAGAKDWSGAWKATVLDPSKAQEGDAATLQIYVFSDIGVALGQAERFERGAPTKIEAVLKLPKGTKAEDVVATAKAQARVFDTVARTTTTVALTGPPQGPYTGTYTTPANTTSNELEVTVEVRIATASNAALVSQSPPTSMLVRRPGGAIQFAPPSLQMPSITGAGTTETELIVLGGDKPGCVWFGTADIPEPVEGAGATAFTQEGKALPGEADCIKVGAKAQLNLTIAAQPDGRGAGTVRGNLQVFEKTQGAKAASTTAIPFRFDLARGVDQAQRLLLSVILLIIGLALPLLALLLINAISARFQTLDVVRGAAVPVVVSGKLVSRAGGTYRRALTLRDSDFGSLAGTGSDRRFAFGGVEFRARASRNPFGATVAMAAPEGGAEKLKGKAGSRVELDPGLSGSWVFLLDPDASRETQKGEAHGLLIAFVAEGDVDAQIARLLPDINDRLPATAERLERLVRETPAKAPKPAKASKAEKAASSPEQEQEPVDEPAAAPEPETPAAPPTASPSLATATGVIEVGLTAPPAAEPVEAPADDPEEPTAPPAPIALPAPASDDHAAPIALPPPSAES